MKLATWFDTIWKAPTETRTDALARLQLASRVSPMALRRGMKGSRLKLETATKIAAVTGGAVAVADLVVAPTEKSVRASAPKPRRGRPRKQEARAA